MASTTRWRDTVVENIDQAIQKLIDDETDLLLCIPLVMM